MTDQPRLRQLYEFDTVATFDVASEATHLGWWDGRRWVACFGDGMWSADYVTAYRPVLTGPTELGPQDEVSARGLRSRISRLGKRQPPQSDSAADRRPLLYAVPDIAA